MNIITRLPFSFALVLLLGTPTFSQVTLDDAIDLLGQYRVSRLDSLLPRMPFLTWFKSVVGAPAKIEWEINDCGEQVGAPAIDAERDIPACLEITAVLPDQRKVGVAVMVGTERKGLSGLPVVSAVYLESGGEFFHLKRLSDLPRAIAISQKK